MTLLSVLREEHFQTCITVPQRSVVTVNKSETTTKPETVPKIEKEPKPKTTNKPETINNLETNKPETITRQIEGIDEPVVLRKKSYRRTATFPQSKIVPAQQRNSDTKTDLSKNAVSSSNECPQSYTAHTTSPGPGPPTVVGDGYAFLLEGMIFASTC